MERLTRSDAAVLELDSEITEAHGMVVAIFPGPRPPTTELTKRVADRVAYIPRYQQRLVTVPYDVARPVWINDPNFSLDFHLRHTGLPEPTDSALRALIGRMQTQRFDRHKPLWELWIVDGLRDGRWAIMSKVHYAMLDGVSGTDILGLLDDSIDLPPILRQRRIESVPSQQSMLTAAMLDLATDPFEAIRLGASIMELPLAVASDITRPFRRGRDHTRLGRAQGPHRRWWGTKVELSDLREIRKKDEVSTTDVILAAVSGGLRRLIVESGRPMPTRLNALVPLSVDRAQNSGSGQIATITANLPVAIDDPIEVVQRVHAQTATGAERSGAIAGAILRRQEHFVAPTILAQGVRAALLSARQNDIDTSVINVPGPATTITVLGQPIEEAYPVVPLIDATRVSVAALSIGETVYFGVTGDWDTTRHIEVLASGIGDTIQRLLDA